MPGAAGGAGGGQRDVDGLLDEDSLVAFGLQLCLPLGEGVGDRPAGAADALARLGAGRRGQGADLAVGQGDR